MNDLVRPVTAAVDVATAPSARLNSLDQFRGFTVLGMFLVNYFAGYVVCPQLFRHTHDYCSYADIVMPQFLFAVGFSLQMTLAKRMAQHGRIAVYRRVTKRMLGLALVSFVVYSVGPRAENWQALSELGFWGAIQEPLKRQWFQTLMQIAVTSLWILPVLNTRPAVRIGYAIAAGVAHIGLSYQFNYIWTNQSPNAIDGGPLGFLTWTTPAILGTLAADWFAPQSQQTTSQTTAPTAAATALFDAGSRTESGRCTGSVAIRRSLQLGGLCMLVAWVMSCGTRMYDVVNEGQVATVDGKIAAFPVIPPAEQLHPKTQQSFSIRQWLAEPPLVRPPSIEHRKWNYWMMSQRGGTWSYTLFAGGFALALYSLFYLVCDRYGYQLGLFRTFGTNALLAYVLHDLVSNAVQPFFPRDSPAWYALLGLALFFAINWTLVRAIEKQGIHLRV